MLRIWIHTNLNGTTTYLQNYLQLTGIINYLMLKHYWSFATELLHEWKKKILLQYESLKVPNFF